MAFRWGAPGLLVVFLVGMPAAGQDRISVDDWKADLAAFRQSAPTLHKNLFHAVSRSAFDELLDSLDRDLPRLSRNDAIVRLAQVVARIGDGHTLVDFSADGLGFHQLPVLFYRFADGFFIVAGDATHASLVGSRLKAIGDVSADEVFRRVSTVAPADNDSQALWITPTLMSIPELLDGLDIVTEPTTVPIVVEANNRELAVSLTGLARRPIISSWNVPADWQQLRMSARPLWIRRVTDPFWMEALPNERAVYVQINGIYPKPNQSLSEFFDAAIREAEKPGFEKLVLDLRLNTGGNSGFLLPLVHRVIRSDKFSRRGLLFVITGRQTFSAAQNLVNYLEIHTPAIFVGEPTAGRPNHYGDAEVFVLPRTGIPVRFATTWWQVAGPKDTRTWSAPEIFVEASSTDLADGRDPALQAALDWNIEATLGARVLAAVRSGRPAEAARAIDEFRSDPRSKFASAEADLYRTAADRASAGDVVTATLVLEAVVEAMPQSVDAHDQLAEMYLRGKRVDRAIAEFERALQLDPKDATARIMLSRLKR